MTLLSIIIFLLIGGISGWLAGLLVLNIVLSGFNPVVIGGMVGALAMGWGLALALRYGER